jgi:hypothetical protein
MAQKAENTKAEHNHRETWSGDDMTRALTTAYDRAAIPIAALFKGVTSRKSKREVDAVYDRIADGTAKLGGKQMFIVSTDVSA